MATYEQTVTALKKAHEAGNVEHAQKLAAYARQLKNQQNSVSADTAPEQPRGIGKRIADAVGGAANFLGTAAGNVAAGTISAPRELGRMAANMADRSPTNQLDPRDAPFPLNQLPSYQGTRDAMTAVGVPDAQPEGTSGKAAMTIAEFMLDPTSALKRGARAITEDVATNALAGTGYVAGSAAFEGNPVAETAGGFAGALAGKGTGSVALNRANELGITGSTRLARERAEDIIRRRGGNVSEQVLQDARGAQQAANEFGFNLMGNEAINNPNMSQLASAAMVSPAGARMSEFVRNRADVIDNQAQTVMQGVGGAPKPVEQVGRQLEKTSNKILRDAEGARTAEYQATVGDLSQVVVPKERLAPIAQKISADLKRVPESGTTAKTLREIRSLIGGKGGLYTNGEVLNNALTEMQARLNKSPLEPNALDKQQKKIYTDYYTVLKQQLTDVSSTYKAAEDQFGVTSRAKVNPLKENKVLASLVRQDFNTEPPSFSDFTNAVRSKDVSPATISKAAQEINAVDPDLWRQATGQYMRSVWDKASKARAGSGGQKLTTGAEFVRQMGTPQEKNNFFAMLRGIDQQNKLKPDTSKGALQNVEQAVSKFMRALERTDVTPGMGSPTQMRQQIASEAGENLSADLTTLNPQILAKMVGLDGALMRENFRNRVYEEIIDILTRPDTVDVIERISKEKKPSKVLQLIGGVSRQGLQTTRESQQEEQERQ